MIWVYFAAIEPEHLAVTESTRNSFVYQSILEPSTRAAVQKLNLGQNCVIQQGNDPSSEKEMNQGVAMVQSIDLSDLNRAVQEMPANLNEPKHHCKVVAKFLCN